MSGITVANGRQSATVHSGSDGRTASNGVAGSYQGHSVREYPNQASLLVDSLEELSEAVSDEVDVDFEKREIQTGRLRDIVDDLLELDGLSKQADSLADLGKGQLRRALNSLLQQRFATSDQLRRFVGERFKDPSHQYVVLSALLQALTRGRADGRRIAAVQHALDDLQKTQGPQIRAGINVTAVASERAAGDPNALGALRQTYRDAVLGYAGMTETYQALIKRYGATGLGQALKFLIAALGADLDATAPSIDRSRLRAIVEDIYRLEVLSGLAEDCNEIMRRVDTEGGCRGNDLLSHVIDLVQDRWPTGEKIGRLPSSLCVYSLASEIMLLKQLRELLRLLPTKVYTADDQRPRLLDAAQDALDAAIDREEEAEA